MYLLTLDGHDDGWDVGLTDNVLLEWVHVPQFWQINLVENQSIIKVCIIYVFMNLYQPIILRLADRNLFREFGGRVLKTRFCLDHVLRD